MLSCISNFIFKLYNIKTTVILGKKFCFDKKNELFPTLLQAKIKFQEVGTERWVKFKFICKGQEGGKIRVAFK